MTEQPNREWRFIIGKTGQQCEIFLNGEKLTYVATAELYLSVGQPSTLTLYYPLYATPVDGVSSDTFMLARDTLTAEGSPMCTVIEIGGKRYRLVAMKEEGDIDDGLFGRAR